MFLSVKEMEKREIRFDESFQPGQMDFSGEDVEQGTPLRAAGSAELLPHRGREVRIQGRYTVEMTAECDRCLGLATFALNESFDLFYRPMAEIAHEEEVAIDDAEAEIGFYEGGGLELEDVLRERVLLVLPMQRICSEACRGICPVCGKNRNDGPCDCKPDPEDGLRGAFRKLHIG